MFRRLIQLPSNIIKTMRHITARWSAPERFADGPDHGEERGARHGDSGDDEVERNSTVRAVIEPEHLVRDTRAHHRKEIMVTDSTIVLAQ